MPRTYYGVFDSVTTNAAGDLWQLTTSSTIKARLLGWEITSTSTAAEDLELELVRAATAGSGGSAMAENPADPDDGSATAVGLVANSTPASGTITDLQFFAWEQLGPVGMIYPEPMIITLDVSTSLVLRCTTTPTAFELNGWVCWEEL